MYMSQLDNNNWSFRSYGGWSYYGKDTATPLIIIPSKLVNSQYTEYFILYYTMGGFVCDLSPRSAVVSFAPPIPIISLTAKLD